MRPLLPGVAALSLFAAAAFAGVWIATADGPPARKGAAEPIGAAPGETRPDPPAPLPAGGAAGPFYRPPPTPSSQPASVPRVLPRDGSWEAIPAAARASALGAVGADVRRELVALQEELSTCFSPDVASRTGRAAPTRTLDPESHQDLEETILVLELESGSGGVHVVDAPIQSHGAADDMTIACAQRLLRGRTIRSNAARPGERHRLLLQLHP